MQNSGVYNNYYCPRRPSPHPSSSLDASRPSAPRSTASVAWSPLQPPWTGWSMVHAYPASPASSDVRSPPSPRALSPLHPPPRFLRTRTRVLCAPSTKKDRRKAARAKGREREGGRERRQLTRRCAGMGNAKYTSVPSRSLRSLPRSFPFAIPLSSSPFPRRSSNRSMCLATFLSLFLSHRDIPTPAVPDPAARARGPREINSPSLPFPSPSPSRSTKVADVRRRLHLHCHYESAHVARGMSFLLRAPVCHHRLRPCTRMRASWRRGRDRGQEGESQRRLYNRDEKERKRHEEDEPQ